MTNIDDETEPPIVAEIQAEAERIVKSVCDYLATCGWDYVVLSISRRHDISPSHAVAPGSTAMHVDRARMAPALDNAADALESIAGRLRSMLSLEGVEARGSYVQDKSDHGGGCKEWPA